MKNPQSKAGRLTPVLILLLVFATGADTFVRAVPGFTRLSHTVLSAFPARRTGFVPAERPGAAERRARLEVPVPPIGDKREDVLRRLNEEGQNTYLPAMLAQVDSAIRRWPDERFGRPIHVAIARHDAPGFTNQFAGAIPYAIAQWNGIQLPIRLDFTGGDTTGADVTIGWVAVLDSGRTGKADVTWDQRQYIRRVAIALATHTPDGRELTTAEMTALAIHELGHAIGLAHSADPRDALYPMTRSEELSARDRATARLLYALPTGSLRRS